jgi:hypothetical protein
MDILLQGNLFAFNQFFHDFKLHRDMIGNPVQLLSMIMPRNRIKLFTSTVEYSQKKPSFPPI